MKNVQETTENSQKTTKIFSFNDENDKNPNKMLVALYSRDISTNYICKYIKIANLCSPTELALLGNFICSWTYLCNPYLIEEILSKYDKALLENFIALNKKHLAIAKTVKHTVIAENRTKPYSYRDTRYDMSYNYFYSVDNYDMLLERENLITLLIREGLLTEELVEHIIVPFPDKLILYLFNDSHEEVSAGKNRAVYYLLKECVKLIVAMSDI